MTPAEALLHAIAASFCAPRMVRETCPYCKGGGLALDGKRCWACSGNGTVTVEREPKP